MKTFTCNNCGAKVSPKKISICSSCDSVVCSRCSKKNLRVCNCCSGDMFDIS